MYEVVLVDDDALVIEFLKKFIPWQDYGFQVVAHFQDSSAALAYLLENTYDILITDIGMPKLNGLELIEQLKNSKANSFNVILSCHGEFQFAQQAIKLGAFDYILKETMEESNIIELLDRLKKKLDQERSPSNSNLKVSELFPKSNLTARSKFIEKLMGQSVEKSEWWKEQEEFLGKYFSYEQYTPVLCFIDQYQDVITHYENKTLLQFNLEEFLTEVEQGVQIFFLQNKFFVLFPMERETQQSIEFILKEIHSKVRTVLKFSITTVIGNQSMKHPQLVENMRLLYKNNEQRFYFQHDSIQYFRSISYSTESIFQDYVEVSQKLKELILKDQKEQIVECISQQLNKIREKKYSPDTIKDWVIKLIYDVKLSLNALKHFETLSIPLTDHFIQYVETFEHLEGVLEEIFDKFIQQINSIDLSTSNEDVLKAQKYVQTHLGEKISLTEVAAHLHLNASYFSRMYKKETGEGFVEYVTRVKMAKAIELLDHSTKSVEQIAFELGFESKSYFLKTFKKFYGISPKSYKYKDKVSLKNAHLTNNDKQVGH